MRSASQPPHAALAAAARAVAAAAAALPTGDDFALEAALSPAFAAATRQLAARAEGLLRLHFALPPECDADADGLSTLLDAELDAAEAALRAPARPGSHAAPYSAPQAPRAPAAERPLGRPQDSFAVPADNSEAPFVLPPPVSRSVAGWDGAQHPFAGLAPPPDLSTPEPRQPLAEPPVLVDTVAGLAQLVSELAGVTELALDTEAHSLRSFSGFVCLLQLSTRSRDYLVDALALRAHLRAALGPVFEDAGVLKVLHGGEGDVVWLQRDFGLYLLHVFDTGQAARVLGQPAGLAHLLHAFCGVSADKRFQLADWRLRPLPPAMQSYAAGDTRHLLFLADRLRAMLAEAPPDPLDPAAPSALRNAWLRSAAVAQRVYRKPSLDARTTAAGLLDRAAVALSAAQRAALEALLQWRDTAARRADESPGYVLPGAVCVRLAASVACADGAPPPSARGVAAVCARASPFAAARAAEVAAALTAGLEAYVAARAASAAAPAAVAAAPTAPLALHVEERPRKRRAAMALTPAQPGLGALLAGGVPGQP